MNSNGDDKRKTFIKKEDLIEYCEKRRKFPSIPYQNWKKPATFELLFQSTKQNVRYN